MSVNPGNVSKKKKIPVPVVILIVFLLVGSLLFWGFVIAALFGGDEEPDPDPEPEPNEIIEVKPVKVEDIQNTPTVLNVGDITIELTIATAEDEKELSKKSEGEVLVTGKTNDGNNFTGKGDSVIVTSGKEKVKATVKSSEKKTDPAKVAAVVSASMKDEGKAELSDFNLKQSHYFAEIADCNVFYPTQMKLTESFDEWLHFVDTKSDSELFVRFTSTSQKNRAGLASLQPAKYSSSQDYKVVRSSTEGNGYLVETALYYHDNFSYVYDILKNLVKIQFMEPNTAFYSDTVTYGTNTEMRSLFFPDYSCSVIIPQEFGLMASDDDRVYYYKDYIKDHTLTISFSELAEDANTGDIFDIFDVVAADGAVILSEDSVTWHNGSGIHIGAANCNYAVLLEVDGADSWDSYSDSLEYWQASFSYNTMYYSYADLLRDRLLEDCSEDWTAVAELEEMEAQMLEGSDPGDLGQDGSDTGNKGLSASDAGNMSDPGDQDYLLTNYEKMKKDSNSLINSTPFTDLDNAHDEWDGEISCVNYFLNNEREYQIFWDDVIYLKEHSFSVVYSELDLSGCNVLFLTNNKGLGVWIRYNDSSAEVVCFREDYSTVSTRAADKIYFSEELKKIFIDQILFDVERMGDFILELNNAYNSIHNYWVIIDDASYHDYYYEMDADSYGLNIDVFVKGRKNPYVGTYIFSDYDLYEVQDDGSWKYLR